MRYQQLLPIIAKNKPETIVEVGTWSGDRAIMMAVEALKYRENVMYFGFDLFEDATSETDARELNVKQHFSVDEVVAKLNQFKKVNPGFDFRLFRGDTNITLKSLPDVPIDLAFIDGGHSIETIRNDYEALKHAKVIVMDDYYEGVDTTKWGCNFLMEGNEDALILPQKDPVKDGGMVMMLLMPRSAWPGKINLVVKTRNCVPDEDIQSNIRYSVPKMSHWVRECAAHNRAAVVCSGGPSLKDHMDRIKDHYERGDYIFCVKHSHDPLISADIIPFGCFLLDPRDHVQDFIENPHPDVTYFTASMVHPTTLDRLLERGAKIIGYNAHVGAGEEKVLAGFGKHILLGGGSTSATRGISVLHTLGFREYHLYGYDSCYYEPQDTSVRTKTGQQKYFETEVSGRRFWTDSELIAQAQDFEKLLKVDKDLDLHVYGDGMIPHIWTLARRLKPSFEDFLHG